MTLISILKETPIKELLRAVNSNKEYLYFNINIFNTGAIIFIKCTDIYKEINENNWNGYDFILENDYNTKYCIAETLKDRLNTINNKSHIRRAKQAIKEYL